MTMKLKPFAILTAAAVLTTLLNISPCIGQTSPFAQSRNVSTFRDAVSKKPIGNYVCALTYRFEVDMNAFDSTAGYMLDYDIMRLEISSSGLTRFYSISADICDSVMLKARLESLQKQNHSDRGVALAGWMPEGRVAIYDDYWQNWPEKGTLTVRYNILHTEYEYSEPLPTMNWIIIPDAIKEVCGYPCYGARVHFRGRDYTAWYCLDLPFNAGPWKFSGLPGLIMAVEESSGIFSCEVIGVSQKQGNIHIHDENYDNFQLHYENRNEKQTNYRIITRRQAVAIDRRRWADPWGFALDKGIMVLSRVNENSRETVEATSANREQFALPEVPALELE